MPVKFTAGETTHIDLGVSGRHVTGQLRAPHGEKPTVGWNFVLVQATGNGRDFQATVDPEGNFCIDDEVLASAGVTDLSGYAYDPAAQLLPDFFI